MTQPNSEKYREETAISSENGGSSTSAANGQGIEGKGDLDNLRLDGRRRESPSSQVGYGGGDDQYSSTPSLLKQGLREGRSNEDDSRFGQDQRGDSDSGTTGEQQQGGSSRYGSVNPDANPSEAGIGSSGPGGYPEEEGYNFGGLGDVSSRSSGAYGRGDIEGSSAGDGSTVRNGVPRRVTSDGVASGAGVSNELVNPTSDDIEQHTYHQTEVSPSEQKHSPYSQLFTESDGPSEGSRDHFHEEDGISGNTKGGTSADQHKEAAMAKIGADHEKEGLFTRLKHKLSDQSHDVTDSSSGDVKGVDSDIVAQEDEKSGVVTTLKEKLLPNHEKHRDEIDPEFWG